MLLFYTGVRVSEICSILIKEFYFNSSREDSSSATDIST